MKTKVFAVLFSLTGFFAIAGGLYTWGDGSILAQTELLRVLIPWADIVFTGPVSLLSGYGLHRHMRWAPTLCLVTSGVYLFGSVLVFITILWNRDYSAMLFVPSISGLFIGTAYILHSLSKEKSTEDSAFNR